MSQDREKDWNRYSPTAARPQGAQSGRATRPQSITLDIHSHVAVPQAAEFVKPHLDPATIPLANFATPETKALNARQDSDRTPLMVTHDKRLADLDAMGIDLQVVMCPPPQCYYTVPLNVAVKAARIVNEGVAAYVAARPDRFAALGTVPMPDGDEAALELEHCMTALKFRGVQILTNVAGRELSDPAFAPFWKKAEELGAVVLIHPNGFTQAQRLSRFYFNNVIGNPLETTIALHYLIFDGVLERHPGLKIVAVHGGGYLGAYSGRIDHAWGARGDARGDLPKPPSSYLKRIYVDTVVFTPGQLAALVDTFGVEHVLMGTDYPYDMGEYDPLQHLDVTPGLDATARVAIAGGNAKKLFGI
jgi:aminocarboxymuconate-semialdehyde decarboxylase